MEIRELTDSERILLAEELWDSVVKNNAEIELTEPQKMELSKRLAAFGNDGNLGSDWDSVKERIVTKK